MSCPALMTLLCDLPLRGRLVDLHLLKADDYKILAGSCLDPDVWRSTIARIGTIDDLREYLDRAMQQLSERSAVPFLLRTVDNGEPVGSTRLALAEEPNALEIGWTFIAPAYHRRGINVEAKLMLLDYSFDVLGCSKIVFKASSTNERSKAALAKLGATPLSPDGRIETVNGSPVEWFGIAVADWPSRRRELVMRLNGT